MLQILKKVTLKTCLKRLILSLIIFVCCIVFIGPSLFKFFKGPITINNETDFNELSMEYVSFDAQFVIDEFVRQSSVSSKTKVEKLQNIGYLLYFDEKGYFFGAELPSSKEAEMDIYIDKTWKWIAEETNDLPPTLIIKGTWKPLTDKRLKYFNDTIIEDFGEEFIEMSLPYYIDTKAVGDRTYSQIIIGSLGMIISFLYILYILIQLNRSYKKGIQDYLTNHNGVSLDQIENDFNQAEQISKSIWVGQNWIVYIDGIYSKIVANSEVVWAYYYRKTGRYSESNIRLFTINKNMIKINASESQTDEILRNYQDNQPHIVIGYTKELDKLYNKSFDEFLNLKYNKPYSTDDNDEDIDDDIDDDSEEEDYDDNNN